MPRRPRCRAVLKWTGAGLCAVLLAVWFASGWLDSAVIHSGVDGYVKVQLFRGVLTAEHASGGSPYVTGWSFRHQSGWGTGWDWLLQRSHDSRHFGLRRDTTTFPLLILVAPLAPLPAWLFYRDHRTLRRALRGLCPACGYSLSGLPPGGACPECGRGLPGEASLPSR